MKSLVLLMSPRLLTCRRRHRPCLLTFFLLTLALFPTPSSVQAQDTCAVVRIQIRQEVTLERQAFEARMTINNSLPDNINNVKIALSFKDESENTVRAAFLSGGTIINDTVIDGTGPAFFFRSETDSIDLTSEGILEYGSVATGATANMKWLIIPAQNSGGDGSLPNGKLYYVGARLTYLDANGAEKTIDVDPDYIYVRPQPNIRLDYFLPQQVYGDNPQTTGLKEPSELFPLGVRVWNVGGGTAFDLAIESAQPEIISNARGLAVDFRIHGAQVNNQPAAPDLKINFGDMTPAQRSIGLWHMTSTVSGQFTEFQANFTHADELGGSVTSLLTGGPGYPEGSVPTHFLLHDILVDLDGTDQIPDFLAYVDESYRDGDGNKDDAGKLAVFHSENWDNDASFTVVEAVFDHRDDDAKLPIISQSYGENVIKTPPVTSGAGVIPAGKYIYMRALDPYRGLRELTSVTRSTGKLISPQNYWFSSRQQSAADGGTNWVHYLNIFDINDTGADFRNFTYILGFAQGAEPNRPPLVTPLVDRYLVKGQLLQLKVHSIDPDGTVPSMQARNRPVGSTFVDNADGTADFSWRPDSFDDGFYVISFIASDGIFNATENLVIWVSSESPLRAWQERYFDDPNSVAAANGSDPDGDGMPNLYEYALGMHPLLSSAHLRPRVDKVKISGKHYLTITYQRLIKDTDLSDNGGQDDSVDPMLDFEILAIDDARRPVVDWTTISSTLADRTNIEQILPDDPATSADDLPAGMERVRVIDTVALEDSPTSARFLRLRVKLLDNFPEELLQ